MHIEITGRNLQVEETLRQQVEHKLEKLSKFLSEPIEARLTLDVEKHRHIAELHVTHRAGVLQAEEETGALMLDAVHAVLDKTIEQARRFHSKQVTQRRRGERGDFGEAAEDSPVAEPAGDSLS